MFIHFFFIYNRAVRYFNKKKNNVSTEMTVYRKRDIYVGTEHDQTDFILRDLPPPYSTAVTPLPQYDSLPPTSTSRPMSGSKQMSDSRPTSDSRPMSSSRPKTAMSMSGVDCVVKD